MAWWPGMIQPGQDPIGLIQITDLFTTAARLGGVLDKIPNDRVTDGIDQSGFLLLGEGHSHRNYIFHYNGNHLGAFLKSRPTTFYAILAKSMESFTHTYGWCSRRRMQ